MTTFTIPTLETDRLILRAPVAADFPAWSEFYASDRAKFVGGPVEEEPLWRGFAAFFGHHVLRGYGMWAVEEKATGQFCGMVGPWAPLGWPEPEIGWSLIASAEGRGIGLEAGKASLDYAYTTLGWTTAISLIDPANTRSIALAEKLGAIFETTYDHIRFGMMHIYRHAASEASA